MGYGTSLDPTEVILICGGDPWHRDVSLLTAEQALSFRLTVEPERLLDRPMWIVGEDHPCAGGFPLGAAYATPGFTLYLDGRVFVVASVEPDKVWITPAPSNHYPE
jgi:hypothetical protein